MTKDEALKIALDYVLRTTYWTEGRDRHDTLKAIKEALAQPEKDAGYVCVDGYRHPAAFIHTTPPKREWVGLTDEEMDIAFTKTFGAMNDWDSFADGCNWAEKMLKEKNA